MFFLDERKTSIVPLKRLVKKLGMRTGDQCDILWSDKKKYQGTLIFTGMIICLITRHCKLVRISTHWIVHCALAFIVK